MKPDTPDRIGRFQVIEQIGRGAFGVVYKCEDPRLNRFVAVKILSAAKHADGEVLERFKRESELAAMLSHPNIVQVFEAGEDDGAPYYVLEFVEGGSLLDNREIGRWSVLPAIQLTYHLAQALEHSHALGIIHRDIKPANILIDSMGRAKLTDFGLARLVDESRWMSGSGALLGTPNYMSPEQALLPSSEIDQRADIYSLGVVLYELLAGQPLIQASTPLAALRMLVDEEPTLIEKLRPELPKSVSDVVAGMICKDRDQRIATASVVTERLREILMQLAFSNPNLEFMKSHPEKVIQVSATRLESESLRRLTSIPNSAESPKRSKKWLVMPLLAASIIGTLIVALQLLGVPFKSLYQAKDGESSLARIDREVSVTEWLHELPLQLAELNVERDLGKRHEMMSQLRAELNWFSRKHLPDDHFTFWASRLQTQLGSYRQAAVLRKGLSTTSLNESQQLQLVLDEAQWEILILQSIKEPVLRPSVSSQLRSRLSQLSQSQSEETRILYELITAAIDLSGSDRERRTILVHEVKSRSHSAEVYLWSAVVALNLANQAHREMRRHQIESPEFRNQRTSRDSFEGHVVELVRNGLQLEPFNPCLLYLKIQFGIDRVDWRLDDRTVEDERDIAMLSQFEPSYRRFRATWDAPSPEIKLASAIQLANSGRRARALDELDEASDQSKFDPLHTALISWLRLTEPTDGQWNLADAGALLQFTNQPNSQHPDYLGLWVIRSLLHSAIGDWKQSMYDLTHGREAADTALVPPSVSRFDELLQSPPLSEMEFRAAMVDLLWGMPTDNEIPMKLQEKLLADLVDRRDECIRRHGIYHYQQMLAWSHFRLAKMLVALDRKEEILAHIEDCLRQRTMPLNVAMLETDSTLLSFNQLDEFLSIYERFRNVQFATTNNEVTSIEKDSLDRKQIP